MILAAHTSCLPHGGRLTDLVGLLRARGRRIVRLGRARGRPSAEDALVRALCHDMRSSLSCLESALRCLGADKAAGDDVLAMAQAQAAHLASMLRTAEATGGAPPHDPGAGRPLPDVLAASVAASGLPRRQLTATLSRSAADVMVGDTRLQRILVNLLENAHRHGAGAPVRLDVTAHDGWVELAVNQSGGSAARVAGHLRTAVPPADVTGLGLWSVQRQARELGGRVVCEDGDGALIIRVQLPDR